MICADYSLFLPFPFQEVMVDFSSLYLVTSASYKCKFRAIYSPWGADGVILFGFLVKQMQANT